MIKESKHTATKGYQITKEDSKKQGTKVLQKKKISKIAIARP